MNGLEIVGLVLLATAVAAVARRLGVPAPPVLVVAGLVAGLVPWVPPVWVSAHVLNMVVLPPLLFAAGLGLSWALLRRLWVPVVWHSVGLVVVSTAVVAAVALAVTPLPWQPALLLGALLASTDSVAVSALARQVGLAPRVRTVVEAEGLFNNAASLVLFGVAVVVVAAGQDWTAADLAGELTLLVAGGLGTGALVAAAVIVVVRRTRDPVLATAAVAVAPYTAFVVAEAAHGSGVTAVIAAAVLVGRQMERTAADVRARLGAVSDVVVFVLEGAVFVLIGYYLPRLIPELDRGQPWLVPAVLIAAAILVARFGWVFALSALTRRDGTRPFWYEPAVVSWAGARGAIPMMAALSIPSATQQGAGFPDRDLVVVLTIAVTVISVTVQGSTLAPLVRGLLRVQGPPPLDGSREDPAPPERLPAGEHGDSRPVRRPEPHP